jgi:hypothetical protein
MRLGVRKEKRGNGLARRHRPERGFGKIYVYLKFE